MEGSDAEVRSTPNPPAGRGRIGAFDVARFVLGLVFILLGGGLLLEGALGSLFGSRLFMFFDGVNRAFEFFVGLMAVALGGVLLAGISTATHEGERGPP